MCVYVSWFVFPPFSVCLLMSVIVSGYIITHCMSIYVSPLCLCVFFSLNICISVGLYCHWLYLYICTSLGPAVSLTFSLWIPLYVFGYVCWTRCFSHFLSMNTSICVRLCSHWLYVYRYLSASKFLSVSMSWYIIGKPACIRTSLDWYFFVSLCLCMCEAVSDYIIAHCRCKCTSLDSCCSLSFLSECFYPYSAILSLIVGVQLRLFIPICRPLFLCVFSVSEYIICNSYGCDQSRSARSLITVKDTVAHSESHACLRREQRYRKIIFSF